MRRFAFSMLSICLFLFGLVSAADAKRTALIIGNSAYQHAPALPNPANDAADLAKAFEALGYDVRLVKDASRAQLLDELRLFRYESLGADHSVIYYAGHGVEIDRQNYLIPVDAELKSDIDVEYEAVSLNLLVVATSGAKNLQLVVLDACRDNPFLAQMTRTVATRSMGRGLALYEPTGNSLVAYSAKEGTVALDGDGTNSPYANAFLAALEQPQLEIGQFFRRVRDNVINATNNKQEPFLYGSLSADPVYFRPEAPAPQSAQAQELKPLVAPQKLDIASQDTLLSIDLSFWESIRSSQQPTDFKDYLERFPDGQFSSLAERRLASLSPGTLTVPRETAPRETAPPVVAPLKPLVKPAPVTVPEASPITSPETNPEIKLSRAQARDLQARLNILGHGAGGEDGLIGRRTLSAVTAFRASIGATGGTRVDQNLLDQLSAKVPASRLTAYREEKKQRAATAAKAAPKTTTKTTTSSSKKQTTKTAAASGNLSGFVGRTFCRKKTGGVENGSNFSDRPINCYTILSLSQSAVKYRVSSRLVANKKINTSTFTRRKSGTRSYAPISFPSSGTGYITASGSTFVSSSIRK